MIIIMSTQVGSPIAGATRSAIVNCLTARSITPNISLGNLGKLMRYDDNHKERTRARVLAEAAAAIRRRGVERVGVAEVMAAAGLTHGGFYAHFESKDDLIAQAITHMFDTVYGRFLSVTEGREPAEAIARSVDTYLAPSHRLDRATGCPVAILSGDLPNLSDRARERFADGLERSVSSLAKLAKKVGARDAEA